MMRLRNVISGHKWGSKLKMLLIRFISGREVPDIVRLLYYRPKLFGRYYSGGIQVLLRGPSEWSVGERELFAAFVSRKNQCLF